MHHGPWKTTRDKVFLLSINEAEKYFSSDEARMCEQAMDERTIASGKGIWWRLRSPGKGSNYAAVVHGDGSIGYDGLHVKNSVDVRPAVWIELDISELF